MRILRTALVHRRIFHDLMHGLALLLTIHSTAIASETDVVNERLPLNGPALEAHWRIDCGALIETVRSCLDSGNPITAMERDKLAMQARLCAAIYNQADTALYRACPDFKALASYLRSENGAESSLDNIAEKAICQ